MTLTPKPVPALPPHRRRKGAYAGEIVTGMLFHWARDNPRAHEIVAVIATSWNGEEFWVETRGTARGGAAWNDEDHFRDMATPFVGTVHPISEPPNREDTLRAELEQTKVRLALVERQRDEALIGLQELRTAKVRAETEGKHA